MISNEDKNNPDKMSRRPYISALAPWATPNFGAGPTGAETTEDGPGGSWGRR